MKKIYISIFALVISVGCIAQVVSENINSIDFSQNFNQFQVMSPEDAVNSNNSISLTNIIWESDFSDPSDWVLDNSGQNPPDYGWSIDPNSSGWWSSNGINSTSGGNFAELSNGNPQASTQAGGVIYTMTTAQPINIFDSIGSGNATLSFEEYGARFYDLQEVQISTDGMNFVSVGDNMAYSQLTASGGSAYPNPALRQINLVNYLGTTPTTVWIRFSWTSELNLAITDQYYYNTWIAYGWYIDDVKVIESPANRITMEDEVIGGFWLDYLNYSASCFNYMVGLDYSVTPLSQLQNHPYAIEALFRNEGTSSQTVNLEYDVTGTMYSGSSLPQVLNPGDSAFLGASFSPATTGSYTIDIWGVADSAGAGVTSTLSNMETREIQVTDYIYGKDLGVNNSSSYILGGLEDQNHITTRFEMYADEQLYSLRIYIASDSDIGAEVKAIIYELDTTSTSGGVMFLAESDNYTLTAQDLGSWIDIPFVDPISLINGCAYEFGAVGFQHPTLESHVGTSGQSLYNGEHSLFDELGLSSSSAGTPTWYYITTTPMVRMNFDPASGVTPSAIEDFNLNISVYPNPSNGQFIIELKKDEKYDLSIYNLLGQTVFSKTISNLKTNIDLSYFEKGIYSIVLKANDKTFADRIVID